MSEQRPNKTTVGQQAPATANSTQQGRGAARSSKLERTLSELESALAEWDALKTDTAHTQSPAPQDNQSREEFKKKTKELLLRLREQLSELEE